MIMKTVTMFVGVLLFFSSSALAQDATYAECMRVAVNSRASGATPMQVYQSESSCQKAAADRKSVQADRDQAVARQTYQDELVRQSIARRRSAWGVERDQANERIRSATSTEAMESYSLANLDTLVPAIRNETARLRGSSTYDPSDEPECERLDRVAESMAIAVSDEKACRVDKPCMAARAERHFVSDVVGPLCQSAAIVADAKEKIAYEKANPAHVVDLVWLHDQGQRLQEAVNSSIPLRAAYRRMRGHEFSGINSERACTESETGIVSR
jgi:hypothetical protein